MFKQPTPDLRTPQEQIADLRKHNQEERAHQERIWKLRARDATCPKCFDTGYAENFVSDDLNNEYASRITTYICECRALQRQSADEHRDKVPTRPLDSFKQIKQHHTPMMRKARDFIAQEDKKFFFVGGQVGSGKTHLCEIIVKELFEKHQRVTMVVKWREISKKLKSDPMSDVLLMELKAVPILYIDDFMKSGGDNVSGADITNAYDIIEGRQGKWTILSSEYTLNGVKEFDASIASRVNLFAGNTC